MKPIYMFILGMLVLTSDMALAQASIPATIPVQGRLTDIDGQSLVETQAVTFRIYDGDGEMVFEERRSVDFEEGVFTIYLGQEAELDWSLFREHAGLELSVAVGDDAEMVPRLPFGAVPYAGVAEFARDADTLNGMRASDFAQAGHDHGVADIADLPPGLADGDDDTTYTAGGGLMLSDGNEFSVDAAAVEGMSLAAQGPVADDNPYNHAKYTAAEARAAMGAVEDGNPYAHGRYSDANAIAAVAGADTYVRNGGDIVDGDLTLNGNLVVSGEIQAVGRPVQISKLFFYRDGASNIRYFDTSGTERILTVGDGSQDVTGTHLAYRVNASGDSILYFNLVGVPSIACTLLHDEDDWPRPGYYFATDGGNDVAAVWGNGATKTFMLSREGVTGLPVGPYSSFQIMCF